MHPYFTGLLFGIIFIFSLGPGFFALIQTSVQKGFKKAVLLAVGISISDVVYVILAIMGVASLLESRNVRMWMAIFGTVLLVTYGIYSWFKKPRVYQNEIESQTDLGYLKYIAKGFLLNGFNPFIVVFWLGIIGLVAVNYDYSDRGQIYFFCGVLTTILITDITKAFIAHRLRAMVTPRAILLMNRSVSVILILFGFQMIYFLIRNYLLI